MNDAASPKPSDLQRYVKPYAADLWEDIGTGLELFDNDPDGKIFHQIENSSDPFNATMRLWLKDKTKATWSNLLACLKEIPGLEQAVQSIEENVPGLTNNLICESLAVMSCSILHVMSARLDAWACMTHWQICLHL